MRADERKMKQILIDLLSKGIKLTPEGGRITVRSIGGGDGEVISLSAHARRAS